MEGFKSTVLVGILACWIFAACVPAAGQLKREEDPCMKFICESGAVIRGDKTAKKLALVFTGDEFADGGRYILDVLKRQKVPGSFFLTGNFYRNKDFEPLIRNLLKEGHYLGAHSDRHLLYCDWQKRDSLLVTHRQFLRDLKKNYREMRRFGISKKEAACFLPPFEWYNETISRWARSFHLQLINYTPGTLSHADYTTPEMPNYKSSDLIYKSIVDYETASPAGLNGFILLTHIGTAPQRKDKFYYRMGDLIAYLKSRGYRFETVDRLLGL